MSAREQKERTGQTLATLRSALFDEAGRDKDVTLGLASAFRTFEASGVKVGIEFSARLSEAQLAWAFELTRSNMEAVYERSGYGWDEEDKRTELSEQGARFLLVRDLLPGSKSEGQLVGFAHFRFTVQGEVMDMMRGDTCLYVWDLQLEEPIRRRGLGRRMLVTLELIARHEKMASVSVPVQHADEQARAWVACIKGYAPDAELSELCGFESAEEGFDVFAKKLTPISTKAVPPEFSPSTVTMAARDIADLADLAELSELTTRMGKTRVSKKEGGK